MLASEKGGDLTILILRLKAATPSQEKVSHSVPQKFVPLFNCFKPRFVTCQVWKKRQIESGGAMLGPEWNIQGKMATLGYSGISMATKLKIWAMHRIRSAEFLVRGDLPPALPQETLRQARSKFFEAWGVGSSEKSNLRRANNSIARRILLYASLYKEEHVCVSSMVFVYWILAHAWSKNGLVQRGCWDRHRNCWEQVLQGVADVQADWPQEAVLVPEHRSATFASLRFMLCWKVRLLWRVLHSRSTAREAACWSRVFGSGFEFRLNAEFENCYELIFLMAHSAWDWCWIFHMVDEFGIPRSANFGLQHLTCCRTSCPNWCSVQSWNPREWWFLPERAVPQGKYEVKWSIWWTSLGKKYQNTH